MADVEDRSDETWRPGWASIGAVVATLVLIGLVAMVTLSNRARDNALAWERHAYDVVLLTRTADASAARSEAALGRYVLDENPLTGTLYYNEWRQAGRQIGQLQRLVGGDAEQSRRVAELRAIYAARGLELADAASRAAAKRGNEGINAFYAAGLSETGPRFREKLSQIADRERDILRQRMTQTRIFNAEADKLTEWLSWLAVLVGISAILLGLAAYRALSERVAALREADSEASRAQRLEAAVQQRTRELSEANAQLQAEAAERAAAEAQLHQVQKMEAVGQLTGGIAHDFNNMLAVVVGGIDLARRKIAGPRREVEYHLDNAMEGATRAAALTRRLLAFARAEPLLPEAVAPAHLLEGMLDLIDRSLGERINVRTHVPEEPWPVFVDINQLENAILNLAVNARDAMDGAGDLAITIANVSLGEREVEELAAGDYVRIAVADTGSGIAPEHLGRVFEPFFTTKPIGKGTGLGLSQIFAFARQSGGNVAISSTVGQGTTVSLYLPRSGIAAPELQQPREAAAPAAAAGPDPRGHLTILVVEDDPRVSRSTVGALEELGYFPIACSNGAEALEILARDPRIELVVTDVMMPEMTGPELARAMAARHPDVAILFVTGYVGEAGDAEEFAGYGILRKPFTITGLAEAVESALRRPFPAQAAE